MNVFLADISFLKFVLYGSVKLFTSLVLKQQSIEIKIKVSVFLELHYLIVCLNLVTALNTNEFINYTVTITAL